MMVADWSHGIVLTAAILSWFIIGAGLAQTAVYLLQLIVAAYALSRRPPVARSALLWHRYGDVAPPIALLVPAYNEEVNVVESVHSMLALEYPNFEMIVINDGSKDQTLQRLIEGFKLVKFHRPYEEALTHKPIRGLYSSSVTERLFVVDKENGGKADAQNAGINVCPRAAVLRHRRRFDPRTRCAHARRPALHRGSRAHDRRRRHDPHRQRLRRIESGQGARDRPAHPIAGAVPDGRVSARLPDGAPGLEPHQHAEHRLRRLRPVPPRRSRGGWRLHQGTMGEDMDLVDQAAPLHARCEAQIQHPVRPGAGVLDRGAGDAERAGQAAHALAARRARMLLPLPLMLFNPRYGRVGFLGFGHILVVDVLGPVAEVLGYVLIPAFWLLGILSAEYLLALPRSSSPMASVSACARWSSKRPSCSVFHAPGTSPCSPPSP